ncbi:ROK family protein [Nitrosomonas marina]|uniref:N-acetylglucosamine kinase n=1 Tax=Nitrosomonas marina TaxID=917 RepID=A0A1H8A9T1_9PROT|nr:ROK family protein [Nitrosomonas marina]SEM67351.1 N-acetylglucosamine kinase [Nitrosomonas marina]
MRIGIDLGGTKIEGVVLDNNGRELLRKRVATPQAEGYRVILNAVAQLTGTLEAEAGRRCSIGIGTPGAISAVTGCMKNSNTVCLNGQPLLEDLRALLNRPLRIANDANCFALSEALDGAGEGHNVVFGVIMGTGVGGGVVFNGQLHAGRQHIGGEWGHNILERDGPACYCGHHGCVETLISGPGLAADFHRSGGDSALAAGDIVALAAQGNVLAETAMRRFFDRFGRALATVVNILDPDVIVLGGGLSNVDRLYTEGRERVAYYVFNDEFTTPVLRNIHGDSSGVRGAAQLWRPHEIDPAC